MKSTPDIQISTLRASLKGKVIGADDPRYDDVRRVFFTGFDRRPAAIVRAPTRPTSPASSPWRGRPAPSSRCGAAGTAWRGTAHPRAGSSSTSPR